MIKLLKVTCIIAFLIGASGCAQKKEKTETQKGAETANKKMDYAKGASDVLSKRGESVGSSVGKGVSSLLKGIGSGVQDTVYPPVKIKPSTALDEAGIKINKAQEGSSTSDGNIVEVIFALSKIYKGRLLLKAFNKENVELGRVTTKEINQPADSIFNYNFAFHKHVQFGEINYCTIQLLGHRPVAIVFKPAKDNPDEIDNAVELGQMQEIDESPHTVSLYVIFNKSFKGALQLRVYDATETEIGRSKKQEELEYDADSSNTFEFAMHQEVQGSSIASYKLYVIKDESPRKGKKKSSK